MTTMLCGDFVTVAFLIEYLGMSRGTVYKLIREGRIPSVRLGGSIRVPVAELRRALEIPAGTGDPGGA